MKISQFSLALYAVLSLQGCEFYRNHEYRDLNIPIINESRISSEQQLVSIIIIFDRQPGGFRVLWNTACPLVDPDTGYTSHLAVTSISRTCYQILMDKPQPAPERIYLRVIWTSPTTGYPDETYFRIIGEKIKRVNY